MIIVRRKSFKNFHPQKMLKFQENAGKFYSHLLWKITRHFSYMRTFSFTYHITTSATSMSEKFQFSTLKTWDSPAEIDEELFILFACEWTPSELEKMSRKTWEKSQKHCEKFIFLCRRKYFVLARLSVVEMFKQQIINHFSLAFHSTHV